MNAAYYCLSPLQQSPGMPPMSPASPYVLREMLLSGEGDDEGGNAAVGSIMGAMGGSICPDSAGDDTDGLKGKWGFTPGRDDTLDVSHGMGHVSD